MLDFFAWYGLQKLLKIAKIVIFQLLKPQDRGDKLLKIDVNVFEEQYGEPTCKFSDNVDNYCNVQFYQTFLNP